MAKQPSYLRVEAKANSLVADIYLYGTIGDSDANADSGSFLEALNSLDDNVKEVNLHINSGGGSVFEGLGIVNAIKGSSKTFTGICEGISASMAFVILMACDKRTAYTSSMLMLHQASGIAWGNSHEMANQKTLLEQIDTILFNEIKSATNKTDEEITEYKNGEDHWFSAEDAVTEGFLDSVMEQKAKRKDVSAQLTAFYQARHTQTPPSPPNKTNDKHMEKKFLAICSLLALSVDASAEDFTGAISDLQAKANRADTAEQELADYKKTQVEATVASIKEELVAKGKANVPTADALAEKFADDAEGFKALAEAMPAYKSVVDSLNDTPQANRLAELMAQSFDYLFKNSLLDELKEIDEQSYVAKYKSEFGEEPPKK